MQNSEASYILAAPAFATYCNISNLNPDTTLTTSQNYFLYPPAHGRFHGAKFGGCFPRSILGQAQKLSKICERPQTFSFARPDVEMTSH